MKKTYTTSETTKAFEISKERLVEWINRGFIKPSHPSRGQGRTAIFSLEDIHRIVLFSDLIAVGFRRKIAAKIVKDIDDDELISDWSVDRRLSIMPSMTLVINVWELQIKVRAVLKNLTED